MLRAVWYVPLVAIWSLLVLPWVIVTGVLTLGRWSHRLINIWAPLWGHGVLWALGVRVRVVGKEKLADAAPCILVMNHESFIDMPAICVLNAPSFTALAKREFLNIPVLGWAMWAVGVIFVDRGKHDQAVQAMRRAAERLKDPPRSLFVFPEGTRSRTGQLQPFKLGAFHLALDADVPIVPLVIHGAYERQVPGRWLVVPGEVVIEVKDPVDTTGWRREDLAERARELHERYERWVEGEA